MRATVARSLFVLVVAVSIFGAAPISGAEEPFSVSWKSNHRMDSLLSVGASDLDGDGRSEVLLAGRSYIDREFNVEIMAVADGALKEVWRSPNNYEDYSSLILEAVRLEGRSGVLALTSTRAYLYAYDKDASGYALMWQFKHGLEPGEMAAADFDGDGSDELVVSRVLRKGTHYPTEALLLQDLTAGGMAELGRSPDLGNIRALAAGDVDKDGTPELLCEIGVEGKPGEVAVFSWQQGALVERARQKLTSVPVYGMTIAPLREGNPVLLVATERGRLESYDWANGAFRAWLPATRFSTPLTDVAAGDFDGDSQVDIAVIGYPNFAALLKR